MSINTVFAIALPCNDDIIPYKNSIKLTKEFCNDICDGYYFSHKERLYGDDWDYLYELWKRKFNNIPYDYDALFKVEEEFLLSSGFFDDDSLSMNMYIIEAAQKMGLYVYIYCA